MPSVSQKQHNLFGMLKHNPELAKKLGVSQKVAKDFVAADKGGRYDKSKEKK